jgi:flagellar biosynthesis protein FliR
VNTLAQIITVLLLVIFLVCGYQAGWFDIVLYDAVRQPELVAFVRADVSLAALVGWMSRNEFARGG